MGSRRTQLLTTLVGAVVVALAARSFRRLAIAEHSMEPALSEGDYVIGKRVRQLRRGAIVTFIHPDREGLLLVKRVIGLPGERLTIVNGQVHVGGEVLADRWADGPTHPDLDLEIGAERVALLSDNRTATLADSRTLGSIPVVGIEHQVVFRYWPPRSIGRVR